MLNNRDIQYAHLVFSCAMHETMSTARADMERVIAENDAIVDDLLRLYLDIIRQKPDRETLARSVCSLYQAGVRAIQHLATDHNIPVDSWLQSLQQSFESFTLVYRLQIDWGPNIVQAAYFSVDTAYFDNFLGIAARAIQRRNSPLAPAMQEAAHGLCADLLLGDPATADNADLLRNDLRREEGLLGRSPRNHQAAA